MVNRRKKSLLAGCCCLIAVGAASAVGDAPGDTEAPGSRLIRGQYTEFIQDPRYAAASRSAG